MNRRFVARDVYPRRATVEVGLALLLSVAFTRANAAGVEVVESGPWPALPPPFHKKVTAATRLANGAVMFFRDQKAVIHGAAPAGAQGSLTTKVVRWPLPVDAALAWSDTQTLVFSGDQTFLIDVEDESVVEHDLVKLGLPRDWTHISAAANYDATHWILFKGKRALFYRFPTGKEPGKAGEPFKLSDWWKSWTEGVDAAVSLPDGRLAVFRGKHFKVIDATKGYMSVKLPYAGAEK